MLVFELRGGQAGIFFKGGIKRGFVPEAGIISDAQYRIMCQIWPQQQVLRFFDTIFIDKLEKGFLQLFVQYL